MAPETRLMWDLFRGSLIGNHPSVDQGEAYRRARRRGLARLQREAQRRAGAQRRRGVHDGTPSLVQHPCHSRRKTLPVVDDAKIFGADADLCRPERLAGCRAYLPLLSEQRDGSMAIVEGRGHFTAHDGTGAYKAADDAIAWRP